MLGGNGAAAILNLTALALAARALEPADFGRLALVGAYVLLIQGLVNLNSWQALIRYGSAELCEGNELRLAAWIRLCGLADILSHATGFVACLLILWLAGDFLYSTTEAWFLASVFSVVILFHSISSTAGGLMRLFGHFSVIALSAPIAASVTLLGFGFNVWYGFGLAAYVYVQIVAAFCAAAYVVSRAWRAAQNRNLKLDVLSGVEPIRGEIRSFLRFLLITNVNSSLNLVAKRADLVIVGAVLGDVAVGLYRVAKMFGSVAELLQGTLYMAIYPQLAMMASEKHFAQLTRLSTQSALLAGALFTIYWLAYALFGFHILDWVFGAEYGDAWLVGLFYVLAMVVAGFALPLNPILLAYGRPGLALRAHLAANLLYVCLMFPLLKFVGLAAAGIAYLVYYALWAILMLRYAKSCHQSALARA